MGNNEITEGGAEEIISLRNELMRDKKRAFVIRRAGDGGTSEPHVMSSGHLRSHRWRSCFRGVSFPERSLGFQASTLSQKDLHEQIFIVSIVCQALI